MRTPPSLPFETAISDGRNFFSKRSLRVAAVARTIRARDLGSWMPRFLGADTQALGCSPAVSQAGEGPLGGSNGHAQGSDLPRASHLQPSRRDASRVL